MNITKKICGLLLCGLMVLSSVCIVSANNDTQLETAYVKDDSFYFTFENEAGYTHPSMFLDSVSNTAFKTAGVTTRYAGAHGSVGSVALAFEYNESAHGNANDGIKGFKMNPSKTYTLSADVKMLNYQDLKQAPNVTAFFMTTGTVTGYPNADFTGDPVTITAGKYKYYTVNGDEVFPKENDNSPSGDWGHAQLSFSWNGTIAQNNKTYYIKPQDMVETKVFFRLGANPHGLNNTADFTEEFLKNCGTTTQNNKLLRMEYAMDNIFFAPASTVIESDNGTAALWHSDFENSSWANQTENVQFALGYANAELSDDVPTALASTSTKSLKMKYYGCAASMNGGFMQMTIAATNPAKKLWANRVYEISFWAKGTQAVAEYTKDTKATMQIIPNKDKPARMDRSMNKWQSFNIDTEKPLNDTWQKYTVYYKEENFTALGRDAENSYETSFYLRFHNVVGATQNTLGEEGAKYAYKSNDDNCYTIADFAIYIDDFTVTPLDIVYNGDMAMKDSASAGDHAIAWWYNNSPKVIKEGGDTLSQNAFRAGTITADASFKTQTGIDNANVLKVTTGSDTPYQGVDIENGKSYEISYWAKADDAESVGKQMQTVLNRDIQGTVLDNTVTTLNTEGRQYYGNKTSQTGSIPFYLYGGNLANTLHKIGELKQNDNGETLVYDEYFANMQKDTPTAWGYQYYDGKTWKNTNDKTEITTTDTLGAEWKKYTMTYHWDYTGDHYRLPNLQLSAPGANYSIADVKINKIADFELKNPQVTAASNNLNVGDIITVSYDYTAHASYAAEGDSVLKMYAKSGDNWYCVGTCNTKGGTPVNVKTDISMVGKQLKFVLTPKCGEESLQDVEIPFGGKVVFGIDTTLSVSADCTKVDWSINVANGTAQTKNYKIFAADYNAENQLKNVEEVPFAVTDGVDKKSGTHTIAEDAVKVKLIVMEAESYAPVTEAKQVNLPAYNADPFAGDNEINVVFLGDSLYEGAGASKVETKWVTKVGNAMKEMYEKDGVTLNYYNKGVGGTTTDYSLARIIRDCVNLNPDVVFFSATCNDGDRDTRVNMESAIRTLLNMENPPYVIMTRYTNRSLSSSYGFVEQVAAHYGLPVIDDREEFIKMLERTNTSAADYFISDGVHPNDAGYAQITNTVLACLNTGRFYQKPVMPANKLVADSVTITEMNYKAASDSFFTKTGSWITESNAVNAQTSGDTLSFNFNGNFLALEYGLHKDSGLIQVYVDDVLAFTANPVYNSTLDTFQKVCRGDSIYFNLSQGDHKVEMKTVAQKTDGTQMQDKIYGIFYGKCTK